MSFATDTLQSPHPASVNSVALPYRQSYAPSPADWRDEVLYFLLPDRFSDGLDGGVRSMTAPIRRPRAHRASAGTNGGPPGATASKVEPLQGLLLSWIILKGWVPPRSGWGRFLNSAATWILITATRFRISPTWKPKGADDPTLQQSAFHHEALTNPEINY